MMIFMNIEPINSTDLGQNNRNVEKIFRHKTLKKNNFCALKVCSFFFFKLMEKLLYLPMVLKI